MTNSPALAALTAVSVRTPLARLRALYLQFHVETMSCTLADAWGAWGR